MNLKRRRYEDAQAFFNTAKENAVMITIQDTTWYKTKRVAKYAVVLLAFMVTTTIVDSIIGYYINDPWITFKNDWLVLYGAMLYRLFSTWNYK